MKSFSSDLHQGLAILQRGQPLEKAKAAMLLLHARGSNAESMLSLADEIPHPDFVYFAPQVAGNSWYPYSFLVPLEHNETWLSSALATVGAAMDILSNHRLPAEKVILLGFSQGACLALEYAACNTRRYGGVAGLSGGLIGPPDTPRNYVGTLDSTPIFLGCSNFDPHIPEERVRESDWIFANLGGVVTTRFYPNMGHAVNQDEIDFVQQMAVELVQK